MADKKILTLEIDMETGKVVQQLEEVQKKTKETASSMEKDMGEAMGGLDKVTGGAVTKVKGLIKGVKGVTLGMKSLKAAIASTGIGLLVIALGSLVAYFTSTKRGGEKLERFMAGLSATFSVLTDRLSAFGETLVNAFQNPKQAIQDFGKLLKQFVLNRVEDVIKGVKGLGTAISLLFEGEFKKAAEAAGQGFLDIATGAIPIAGIIKDNAEAIKGLVVEIEKEAEAATKLSGRLQRLTDLERALRVERAEAGVEIEKQKLLADDVTKSTEERLVAAQAAFDLEQQILDRELNAARERVAIISQQNALGESSAEDLDRLAEARVVLADIEKGSLTRQIELQNKLNGIQAAGAAAELAAVKESRDALAAKEALEDKAVEDRKLAQDELKAKLDLDSLDEVGRVEAKYAKMLQLAKGNAALTIQVEDAKAAEIDAIDAKSIANRKAQNQALASSSLNIAAAGIGALISLNEAFSKKDEASKRKAFERDKKLKIAQAVVQSIQGSLGALMQGMSTYPAPAGPIIGGIMGAIATAAGIAQVAKIKKTKYGGGTSVGGAPSTGGSVSLGGSSIQPKAPTIDGNIGQGQTQGSIRAYVVSKDTTNAQSQDQLVEDQAQLVA